MIYIDTSWLVKLYVEETGSAAVRRLVGDDDTVLVSDLSYVEVHSAVARRQRATTLTARAAAGIVMRFRRDWRFRVRVAVSRDVIVRAAGLVSTHQLRSLDALHLASGLLIASGSPEPLRFGAANKRLALAAKAEGLTALEAT